MITTVAFDTGETLTRDDRDWGRRTDWLAYIERGRAQLWSGLRDDAFESLKLARNVAPQHVREHH